MNSMAGAQEELVLAGAGQLQGESAGVVRRVHPVHLLAEAVPMQRVAAAAVAAAAAAALIFVYLLVQWLLSPGAGAATVIAVHFSMRFSGGEGRRVGRGGFAGACAVFLSQWMLRSGSYCASPPLAGAPAWELVRLGNQCMLFGGSDPSLIAILSLLL